jgi:hypothetical protein
MSRKVLHINSPSNELVKFVKNLRDQKEKDKEELVAKKHLYFSK